MSEKKCVLDETKRCDGCGACDRCDLDPNKICDNCMKCLEQETNEDGYRVLSVGRVLLSGADYEAWLQDDSKEKEP